MSTRKDEPSVASRMIRLFTEFPCAGINDGDFELQMPPEISEVSYNLIVAHIAFRRKCMNQGFDNLLELLAMHYDTLRKVVAVAEQPTTENTEEMES